MSNNKQILLRPPCPPTEFVQTRKESETKFFLADPLPQKWNISYFFAPSLYREVSNEIVWYLSHEAGGSASSNATIFCCQHQFVQNISYQLQVIFCQLLTNIFFTKNCTFVNCKKTFQVSIFHFTLCFSFVSQ